MSKDVGVGQLVDELQQRGDRLPFEVGAFVALEACEGLLQDAVRLDPDDIRVTLEGSVVVSPQAQRTGPDEAARSLVSVLSRLLIAAGPGVPPSLVRIVEDSSLPNSQQGLQRLHDLIEASLIPLNRGASRRILARLVRESERPPALVPAIGAEQLDAELDALLQAGLETENADAVQPGPSVSLLPSAEADIDPLESEAVTLPGSVAAAVPERGNRVPDPQPEVVTATISTVEGRDDTEEVGGETATATATFSVPAPEPGAEAAAAAVAGTEAVARTEAGVTALMDAEPEMAVDYERVTLTGPEAVTAAGAAGALAETEPETVIGYESADASEPETVVEYERVTVTGAEPTASEPEAGIGARLGRPSEPEPGSVSASEPASPAEPVTAKYPVPRQASEAAEFRASDHEVPGAPSAEARQPHSTWQGTESDGASSANTRGGHPWRAVLFIALAAVALWGLTLSGAFDALLTPTTPAEPVAAATGRIGVTVFPEDAQIFVFEGRGPAVAEGLSVEGPHEFVVFDQGLEPSRAVVPAGARWSDTDEGPLYELAVQSVPSTDDSESVLNLGSPLSDGHSPSAGPLGRVRVLTNPPHAKVYRLIGLGPEVAIDARSIHEGHEILAFHPNYASRRAVIGPSDWHSSKAGGYEAVVQIRLPRSTSGRAAGTP